MAPQRLFAAFAALSIVIGSGASPCKPVSVTTEVRTTSIVASTIETVTAGDATFTTDLTSTESDYVTDITVTETETENSSAADSTTTLAVLTTGTSAFASSAEALPTTTSSPPIDILPILDNGDFETGSSAPWDNFGIGAFGRIDTEALNAHRGSYSFVMGSAASDWSNTVQVLRKPSLVAGQTYSLSLYAKVSSGSHCTAVEAFIDNDNMMDSFGTRITASGAQLAGDFAGLRGGFTLTQAALDNNNEIRVVIRAKCSNGYMAWIDDVSLTLSN
ncbi:hypothetical protein FLAG1_07878 [Fusarium langsethiae]|uniref:CBM-cenC domain-containing protein n=1 Tax=Fusarium langsethiae TaxID=179993 RepID=A0A0N0DD70_FUSLA|nr:hypothetical protein FLAG1_07878 [Fusarium langsethiae]GKU07743.1 unnamed protein product [Fusarium langsethiae]GKU22714.1 unnamed protein product [Fusarium langsethiae]